MAVLSFLFSAFSLACKICASFVKGSRIKLILLLFFFGNLLLALSYTFAGKGINGAASCYLGSALTFVSYFYQARGLKLPRWMPYLYEVLFVAVNLIFGTSPLQTAIAITATVSYVLSLIQSDGARFRFWTVLNQITWVVFDLCAGSYGPLATHVTLLSSNLMGMLLRDRKKNAS